MEGHFFKTQFNMAILESNLFKGNRIATKKTGLCQSFIYYEYKLITRSIIKIAYMVFVPALLS